MKILEIMVKVFLILVITLFLSYFFFVYKDVALSIGHKKVLQGKIAYSLKGHYIKIINLPSGRADNIYTRPERIRKQLGFVHYPSFSPFGKKIVFSQGEHLFDDKLYIMDSDGANTKLFLDLGDTAAIAPSWSPDGEEIAFIVQERGRQGLYIAKASNPNAIRRINDIKPSLRQPSWSPDGKMIAFEYENKVSRYLGNGLREERDLGGIYIIDIGSGEIKRNIEIASQPAWSPDGNMLICEKRDGYHMIDVIGVYGYGESNIIPYKKSIFSRGGSFPVRWSPDGKYIVFCKEIWFGLAGIYVISVDNPKKQIRIGTDDEAIIGMSWAE